MIKYLDWFTIKVDTSESHYWKFEVYEVDFKVGDERHYPISDGDTTSNLEEADPLFTGMIKFDGCSNWNFKPDDVLMHFCGRYRLNQFKEVLDECHTIVEKNMDDYR